MNLLYNLVAVQPIHNAKFHGGGSYGEVVFRALLEHLDEEGKLFCAYDGKKYLDPDVIAACKERGIPLLDINESSPQKIIDENSIDTFYTPLYSLERKWNINVKGLCSRGMACVPLKCGTARLGSPLQNRFRKRRKRLCGIGNLGKSIFISPSINRLPSASRKAACKR